MTRAIFRSKNGSLCGFTLTGHAGAGSQGSDIVCAAISSAAYMAVNTITDICRIPAKAEVRDGFLRVMVEDAGRCQDILRGLRLHLEQLQMHYPQQLVVEIMEV